MFSLFIATFDMSEIFAFLFCTTKIGEISDMAKCFENFVSQALGFLTSFYAAELRFYREFYEVDELNNFMSSCTHIQNSGYQY